MENIRGIAINSDEAMKEYDLSDELLLYLKQVVKYGDILRISVRGKTGRG